MKRTLTRDLLSVTAILLTLVLVALGSLLILKINEAATLTESLIGSTCFNGLVISKLF